MIGVLGSTGFVGAHLLVLLLKDNQPVVAFKRASSDLNYVKRVFDFHQVSHLFDKITWVDVDLLNYHDVFEVLSNKIDVIFHAAAQVNFNSKRDIIHHNVRITQNIVNAALLNSVKRFCYVSSIATITSVDGEMGIENAPFEISPALNPYSYSKCLAELEVWRAIHEGLPAVIVNPSVILGYSRQWKSFVSLVRFIEKGYHYYPSGIGSFIDIHDVVNIMMHLTLNTTITNQRFILTSENLSYKTLFEYIANFLSLDATFKPINLNKLKLVALLGEIVSFFNSKLLTLNYDTAQILTRELFYSNQKIKDTLNYSFIPVKDTIQYLVNLYYQEKVKNTEVI